MSTRALPYLPWRKPAVESGPLCLTSRRLYILPTWSGLVFAALLLGLLVGAINYGVSLVYLFTFWFVGLAVVGMLHTQRNLSGLVLHGGAAKYLLVDDAYQKAVDDLFAVNLNAKITQDLLDLGVDVEICHSVMKSKGWTADDVLPGVTIVHDGYTRLVKLQNDGYAYLGGF